MNTMDLGATGPERRSKWWWTVVMIPPVAAVVTALLAPDPHGHWSEHLGGLALKAAQLVVLIVVVAMLGWRTLRLLLLIAVAVIAMGIVFQVIGDYQVADSIWRTAGNPGFGNGYEDGHDTSALGDLLVLGGGAAFAILAGVTRRALVWLASIGLVMVIVPTPFFWPAAGALVMSCTA